MKLTNNRNLYNADFGGLFWNSEMWQPDGGPYTAAAIHRFVDNLADNGVDTFIINPGTKVVWYPSKRFPTILDNYVRDDPEFFLPQKGNNWFRPGFINPYLDLKEAGVDWLKEVVKACKKRNISYWASIRMNDPHNSTDPKDPLNNPELSKPELQLGGVEKCPGTYNFHGHMGTRGLNYECQEVRDYMFALIRELIEDYGFKGLELDWLRSPACCRPGASQKTIEMMSAWFARIRQFTDAESKKTGDRIPFGMRVPGNYKMLRHIGIDVKAAAEAGMLDFLCPSNFMQTSWDMPHDKLKEEFGDKITIYGVTELWLNCLYANAPDGKSGDRDRYNSTNPPALRGNAAGKLVLGADGIEQFNFFVGDLARKWDGLNIHSEYSALKGIENLEFLRGREKHYSLAVVGRHCWVPPFDLPEPLPAILEPQWRRSFRLPMCSEPAGKNLELIIQIVVEKKKDVPEIGVGFNSDWPVFTCKITDQLLFGNTHYTHHIPEHQAFNFYFSINLILEGWNKIEVYNNSLMDGTFKIVGIELGIMGVVLNE